MLYDELETCPKGIARGTLLVNRHLVPDLGNELLNLVHSGHMMFALLGQHVRPYIEVRGIKVQGAGRPQSLMEKISQILPKSRLDDIRRVDRCAVVLNDVMTLPVEVPKFRSHNLLQNLGLIARGVDFHVFLDKH